jgi:DNA (cytosine-5)-methyltransferase 1
MQPESSFAVEIELTEGWTLVPNAKGKPMADSPRYRMLGNSFAVPVVRWIGAQIARAHADSSSTRRLAA